MSKSLKRKTNPFLLQETPVPHDHFKADVFPGRCRKEFSPGYKEYILQSENEPEESPVSNDSIVRGIVHFSIRNIEHHLYVFLCSIIKHISCILTRNPLLKAIVYADTTEENYTLNRKQIQK